MHFQELNIDSLKLNFTLTRCSEEAELGNNIVGFCSVFIVELEKYHSCIFEEKGRPKEIIKGSLTVTNIDTELLFRSIGS